MIPSQPTGYSLDQFPSPLRNFGGVAFDFPGINKYHKLALSYATSPTTIGHQENTVSRLEALGLIQVFDLAYLFAANDAGAESFSLLNLANASTFRLTKTLSPTYGVSGWTFPSSGNHLESPFSIRFDRDVSGIQFSKGSCSVSAWLAAYPTVSGDFCGSSGAGGRILLGRNGPTTTYNELFSGDVSVSTSTGAEAAWDLITVSRIGQDRFLYKNGNIISVTRTTGAVNPTPTINFSIGRSTQLGYPTNMTIAGCFLGGHLAHQDHQNLYRELMNYKTSIGL